MSSNYSKNSYSGRSGKGRILYDAHGTRVKGSLLTNKYIRFLLFFLLPYLVINGIILMLVCSSPHISVEVKDTNDYMTAEVDFTVRSLLPIKELKVSLESEPIEAEKTGSTYKCTVNQNGTFTIEATSLNGMLRSSYTDINILDDTAPSIDESSINISNGDLIFTISDTQSGVNYDSIYGVINDTETVYPSEIDKSLGFVTLPLPKNAESIELHFEDMVGNARSGRISVTLTTDDNGEGAEAEAEAGGEGDAEAGAAEGEASEGESAEGGAA